MKLIITGYEPFGDEKINPSWEAVKLLPERIGACELTKLELPVVFGEAAELAWRRACEVGAEAILCVGQAGGRRAITPERLAVNVRHGAIADNAGRLCRDDISVEGAPAAYFTTLEPEKMRAAVDALGLPASISYSAGTYVCNDTLFGLLHRAVGTGVRVGFVHLPFMSEQAEGKPERFSLPLEAMACALEAAVRAVEA